MKVTVLIVDANATNRMALKVKLTGAWYDVAQAGSAAEALRTLQTGSIDIVIASDNLGDMPLATFLQSTSAGSRGAQSTPVIALSSDTGLRTALLDAGAEDVLTRPAREDHLIARVRSVLRARAAEAEWRLRDSTTRALGFAEPVHLFRQTTPLALLEQDGVCIEPALRAALRATRKLELTETVLPGALRLLGSERSPDVVLIPVLKTAEPAASRALAALADLRAHPALRTKSIIVLVPNGAHALAARALDMGADDVAITPPPDLFANSGLASELSLRASRLHMRQQMTRSLRNSVRSGAEAALRDTLTGLYNRRYAEPYLKRIAEQSRETGKPFAIMVADLDHFKRINDSHGHAVGDAVLVECARRLQHNMRAQDLLARIGGEEFLIVLPGTNRADARKAALRLCAQISDKPVVVPGLDTPLKITISVGLALSNTQPDLFDTDPAAMSADPARMLQRADRALYQAKQQGRNQFSLERPAA